MVSTAKQMMQYIENGKPQLDDDGKVIVDMATCGTCGRSWNDAMITAYTPAPGARCPFGDWHRQPRRTSPKQAAYLFFLKHAGYSVAQGEMQRAARSRSARELAKAERDGSALGFTFEWNDNWSCNHEKEFGYTPHACESCVCYDGDSNVVASLGCIDDATREYRRVVEAELAMEALAEVKSV